MTVDTAARRASALTFGGETYGAIVPAGADLNASAERAVSVFGYGAYEEPSVAGGAWNVLLEVRPAHRRTFTLWRKR